MNDIDPEFCKYVCEALDNIVDHHTPDGVAIDEPVMDLTNATFNYYINKHGVPTNANEARKMFEWAATLEFAWQSIAGMQVPE